MVVEKLIEELLQDTKNMVISWKRAEKFDPKTFKIKYKKVVFVIQRPILNYLAKPIGLFFRHWGKYYFLSNSNSVEKLYYYVESQDKARQSAIKKENLNKDFNKRKRQEDRFLKKKSKSLKALERIFK